MMAWCATEIGAPLKIQKNSKKIENRFFFFENHKIEIM
jgi:hypothetical protein